MNAVPEQRSQVAFMPGCVMSVLGPHTVPFGAAPDHSPCFSVAGNWPHQENFATDPVSLSLRKHRERLGALRARYQPERCPGHAVVGSAAPGHAWLLECSKTFETRHLATDWRLGRHRGSPWFCCCQRKSVLNCDFQDHGLEGSAMRSARNLSSVSSVTLPLSSSPPMRILAASSRPIFSSTTISI